MGEIKIIPQPAWITDEAIAVLLKEAHATTRQAGMHFLASNGDAKDNRRRLGEEGIFFTAVDMQEDGKGKLCGVIGMLLHEKGKRWFNKGIPYGELKMAGVLEEYRGQGISNALYKCACDKAFESVDVIILSTAEQNHIVIDSNKRHGWVPVDYRSYSNTNYYSVLMAKWKEKCPFSSMYCTLQYTFRKWRTRLLFKKGGVSRLRSKS